MLRRVDRPRTLKDSALDRLREAITLGELAPGERLVERVLCDRLGVSRTVIRECIRHLQSERLVTSVPNVGPSVAILHADEVDEIYAIREMLECAAVNQCAQLANSATVAKLRQRLTHITEYLEQHDVVEALRETTQFYADIFSTGGKPVSWDLVQHLNGRIGRLRAVTLQSHGRASRGPVNLSRIVSAIEKNDPDAAVGACRAHIAEARLIALQELNKDDTLQVTPASP